jgi:outer membrane cobalamin receptor
MLFVLVLLSTAALGSQTPSLLQLHGVVIDAAGAPVPGAVVAAASGQSTVAGPDGRFVLALAGARPTHLDVTAPGYGARRIAVLLPIGSSDAPHVRIVLMPEVVGETVLVTATRGGSLGESAAAVSVLRASDLQANASPALDDALRTAPGFSLFRRTSSRTANPTTQGANLRAVSTSGASRVLVLADGVPLNDPFGGWIYWNRVPQSAIDRVEVVRGGASDLYGADALGGVIQVLTVRPAGASARLSVEAASHATPRASLFAGTRGARWHASAGAEASATDGVYVVAPEDRGAVDTRAGSDYGVLQLAAGLDGTAWRLRASGNAFTEDRDNGTPLQVNGTRVKHASLEIAGALAGGQLEGYVLAGDQVYRQTFSAIAPSRASETLTARQRVPASQLAVGATWRRVVGRADVLAGAETREVVATNQETSFAPDGSVRAQVDVRGFQRSTGAFGQIRTAVGSATTLVAGARLDLWEAVRGLADATAVASPRLSVSHRLGSRVIVRGAVTSSFRAPTLNERYRGFRAGNVLTLPNADLEPERLLTGEGGALVDLGRGTVRVTAYAGRLSDAVTNVTQTVTPQLITRRRENAGAIRARGIETEGEYRLSSTLTAGGALALTRSTFDDTPGLTGNAVPQVPRWQGSARLTWMAPSALVVSAQVRAFADQWEDDRNTLVLEQAGLLDLSVAQTITRRLTWFGAVENLFDTEYDTGRTPTRTIGFPRTLRAGVRVYLP